MSASVCLSLTGETLERNLDALARHRSLVDLAELRADFLQADEMQHLAAFPARAGLPVILAIRREQDGGRWHGQEGERRLCLERALTGGYAYLDLEEDLREPGLARTARSRGARVIRSFHDVRGVPADLGERLRTLPQHSSELPRAAVTPSDTRDLVTLAETFRNLRRTKEKILIGMGERGLFSRVLAGRLGSSVAYCSAPELSAAASGHLGPRQLTELYRFRRVGPSTRLQGVIGNPIAHSRSPEIHNRGYEALGLDAVYLPFLVDGIGEFMTLADLLGVGGLSVTMPFKQAVIPFLGRQDRRIVEIGACNTMTRRSGGRRGGWYGTNTDVEGFLDPIRRRAPGLLSRPGRATVLGAGGAAGSVVYALASAGVPTLVLNRSPARARALAERFGCAWGGLDADGLTAVDGYRDLIVQATGAGMEPQVGVDPLPGYRFQGTETLFELIYEPEPTPIAARARAAGCTVIPGFEMLLAQARAQFRLHTGREYPRGLYD